MQILERNNLNLFLVPLLTCNLVNKSRVGHFSKTGCISLRRQHSLTHASLINTILCVLNRIKFILFSMTFA